jgi:hypothetical protein
MYRILYLPALLLASHGLAAPVQPTPYDISSTLQNILANTDGSKGYTYPTDLTRGIVPVRVLLMRSSLNVNRFSP